MIVQLYCRSLLCVLEKLIYCIVIDDIFGMQIYGVLFMKLFFLVILILLVNIGWVVFMVMLLEVMLVFRFIVLIVFIVRKYFVLFVNVNLLCVMFVVFFVDV